MGILAMVTLMNRIGQMSNHFMEDLKRLAALVV